MYMHAGSTKAEMSVYPHIQVSEKDAHTHTQRHNCVQILHSGLRFGLQVLSDGVTKARCIAWTALLATDRDSRAFGLSGFRAFEV